MARWEGFRQCPGCGFDIASGEGERSCSWGDCPYLPEELNVFCDQCRFNLFTMEGNPSCEDPLTCVHAVEPRSHASRRLGPERDAATTRSLWLGLALVPIGRLPGSRLDCLEGCPVMRERPRTPRSVAFPRGRASAEPCPISL